MAVFSFTMPQKDAILAVKRAINGKVGILKDKGTSLTVGAPMMTVNIDFTENTVTTTGSLAGKMIVSTVDSCIEITEGFTKN